MNGASGANDGTYATVASIVGSMAVAVEDTARMTAAGSTAEPVSLTSDGAAAGDEVLKRLALVADCGISGRGLGGRRRTWCV